MTNLLRKNNLKLFVQIGLICSLLLITLLSKAQPINSNKFIQPLTKKDSFQLKGSDTLNGKKLDSFLQKSTQKMWDDSLKKSQATIVTVDSFSISDFSKDSLDAPIFYEAKDSGILDVPAKTFFLYGKAKVQYNKLDISAATVEMDNGKNLFRAFGTKDSSGNVIDRVKMNDGEMTSVSDTVFYNPKTQRGLAKSTFTQQGELFVQAERIKKINATSYYASNGLFTTCNLDVPHYAFHTRKLKLVNNKWAYSGLTYPEFEGVPVPIGIPFGIYPLSKGRHSGLLAPAVTATQFYGIGLEGLGYYKVLNPYVDVTLRTTIYSYGGYSINVVPTYRKRYRFNGGVNVTFQKTKFNFKGDPDFSTRNIYSLAWNHAVDSKARPGTSFSANVNISSSKFNSLVPNNSLLNFTNSLNSSIQYSKTWGQGRYNLQASATHSQNNQTGLYNVNLPNITFGVSTFYPFKKLESVGEEKWYEKIGIGYNGTLQNQFSFYDSVNYKQTTGKSFFEHLADTLQWSISHSIPIALTLPQIGPFSISPSVSFQEKWFGQKNLVSWNPTLKKLDTLITRSFFQSREVSTSLSISTNVFGTFNFKNGNLVAIRHTLRPTISINYKPDLVKQFYYQQQVDTLGNFLRFNSLPGGFSEGEFGGVSFGITQQIQAKVKDKTDSTGKTTKKINLIDNFSINSSYNLFADSLKLGDIAVYLGTTLFDKINITASTAIIPYIIDKFGRRTKDYAWSQGKFSLGSINSGSLSLSTNLQGGGKDDKTNKTAQEQAHKQNDYYNPEEDFQQQQYINTHPAEFTDFNVPWTLGLSFSLNFSKVPTANYSGFVTTTTASLNLNGDLSLSPKWKVGGSGFLDVKTLKIQQATFFVTREMHCWQLAINVTPFGPYPSFGFTLNPKSGILRDLKINRTRTFQSTL